MPMTNRYLCSLLVLSAVSVCTGNAQSASEAQPNQPVATVNGQPVYEDDLTGAQGQLQQLRTQEYDIKRKALDAAIEQKLLDDAAKKKGLTTEQLLAQEVNSKIAEPSDAEVEGYYFALKDRINRPLSEVKTQIRDGLKQAKMQDARQEYVKKLRAEANVVVLLSAPRVNVAYDPARLRGNAKAPVMIVEFSDYQCPYCHQVEPTVKQVLAKYGEKVSFSYRDFPIGQLHPQAEIAAEASRCALDQGKFWEYHDQLLLSVKLDKDALVQYAKDLNLDEQKFSACLGSEKYKADVQNDFAEGRNAGVTGTPGFFINGVAFSGAQTQETFARIIDEQLSRKQ